MVRVLGVVEYRNLAADSYNEAVEVPASDEVFLELPADSGRKAGIDERTVGLFAARGQDR